MPAWRTTLRRGLTRGRKGRGLRRLAAGFGFADLHDRPDAWADRVFVVSAPLRLTQVGARTDCTVGSHKVSAAVQHELFSNRHADIKLKPA